MARKSKSKAGVKVDFTGAKRGKKLPEGDYVFQVVKATDEGDYINWDTKVVGGEKDGESYQFRTYLSKDALWSLAQLLEAMGYEVPEDEMDLDLSDFADEKFGGTIIHKEGNDGRTFANVVDFCEPGEIEVEEEDEKPKKKGKKDEEDEEEKPSKKKAKEEEEEEEEDETPTGKGKKVEKKSDKKAGRPPKLAKLSGDEVAEMDEEELGGVVEKYDLDVDLDDFKTLRKKVNAVTEALEEKGMLDS